MKKLRLQLLQRSPKNALLYSAQDIVLADFLRNVPRKIGQDLSWSLYIASLPYQQLDTRLQA